MNFEQFLLEKFEQADFITKRKASIFLHYSYVMIVLLSLLMILYQVMPLVPELKTKGMAGAIGILVLVCISIGMLKTGKLNVAIWSYAIPTILIAATLRIINSLNSPETAFSTYIFYMPYLIVFVAVFGKRWQVALTTTFFFLVNWLVWFQTRQVNGILESTMTTGIINSTMGLLTTGVLSTSLVGLFTRYTEFLKKEAQTTTDTLERVKAAMLLAHDGLHVGERLLEESESMQQAAQSIDREIGTMTSEMTALRENVTEAANSNKTIVESTRELSATTEGYQTITLQASSAVEQMTAAIGSISAVSSKNRDSVETLAESIATGIETADASAHSIASLTESSKSLQDIVEVISSISSQTNLLAMNAAIEAAHAGESGKGFAVVAEEIRHLAEETASNSNTIAKGLNSLAVHIDTARLSNKQTEDAFREIARHITRTKEAFDEILQGMKELATGTTEINASVESVVHASREMSRSIKTMNSLIENNTRSIQDVYTKTERTMSGLASVGQSFQDILNRSRKVHTLGEQSDSVIRDLDNAISSI